MWWFDPPSKEDRVIEAYRRAERRRHRYDRVRTILDVVSVCAAIVSAVAMPIAVVAWLVRRYFW